MLSDHLEQVREVTDGFKSNSRTRNISSHPQTTSLVPLERHLSASRRQFILGALLGALVSLVIAVPAVRYTNSRGSTAPLNAASALDITPGSGSELNAPARSSQESFLPPARPQSATPIVARRPESLTSSPRSGAAEFKAVNQAKPVGTLDELWSGVRIGNISSTLVLADRYVRGDGVTANCTQARVLLLMASKKGSTEAARRLQQLENSCPAAAGE
jgi:hypothetical protein